MNVYWLEQSETDVPPQNDWLCASEDLRLGTMHFAKRRADWRLGRWTAKRALAAYLGIPPRSDVLARIEIRASPSGAPDTLFDSQASAVTISLSHRAGRALCAIGLTETALGCDLEIIEPRSDAFIADYFSPEEQTLVAQVMAPDRALLATLLWSAKESALKALRTGLRLDTRCVTVSLLDDLQFQDQHKRPSPDVPGPNSPQLSETSSWRALRVGAPHGETFHGYWQRSGEFVRTLVAAPAPPPPILLNLFPKDCLTQKENAHEATIHSVA
jgi:4'-phosphopantetheinyl transferase